MSDQTQVAAQPSPTRRRYVSINGAWPADLPKPTPQEAVSGAKRLYRKWMGKAFPGKWRLTSGRRHTRYLGGVFYVNPDEWRDHGGGWPAIVHSMSHHVHWRKNRGYKPHDWRHAQIEREMMEHVIASGWLEGKLRREPKQPKVTVPVTEVRHQRIIARIATWQAKAKRAETALRKLRRQARYYERKAA